LREPGERYLRAVLGSGGQIRSGHGFLDKVPAAA
jgi:hypothetical protein